MSKSSLIAKPPARRGALDAPSPRSDVSRPRREMVTAQNGAHAFLRVLAKKASALPPCRVLISPWSFLRNAREAEEETDEDEDSTTKTTASAKSASVVASSVADASRASQAAFARATTNSSFFCSFVTRSCCASSFSLMRAATIRAASKKSRPGAASDSVEPAYTTRRSTGGLPSPSPAGVSEARGEASEPRADPGSAEPSGTEESRSVPSRSRVRMEDGLSRPRARGRSVTHHAAVAMPSGSASAANATAAKTSATSITGSAAATEAATASAAPGRSRAVDAAIFDHPAAHSMAAARPPARRIAKCDGVSFYNCALSDFRRDRRSVGFASRERVMFIF